jgi:hypothetical protein
MFFGCSSLISIHLPASLVEIRKFCFDGCSSLLSLAFPSFLVFPSSFAYPFYFQQMYSNCFVGCSSVVTIIILNQIPCYEFEYLCSLQNISMPTQLMEYYRFKLKF